MCEVRRRQVLCYPDAGNHEPGGGLICPWFCFTYLAPYCPRHARCFLNALAAMLTEQARRTTGIINPGWP